MTNRIIKVNPLANCPDCYQNNPSSQNLGMISYAQMSKPNPCHVVNTCCDDPEHSGIYVRDCIIGNGTHCDPLRIDFDCLSANLDIPSGSCECETDCTIDQETCVWRVEGVELRQQFNWCYNINVDELIFTLAFPEVTPVFNLFIANDTELFFYSAFTNYPAGTTSISPIDLFSKFAEFPFIDPSGKLTLTYNEKGFCLSSNFLFNDNIRVTVGNNQSEGVVTPDLFCQTDIATWGGNINLISESCLSNNRLSTEFNQNTNTLQIFRNGTWTTVTPTDEVYESTEEFTAWRIIDSEENVIEEGEPEVVCTGEPVTKTICEWIADHEERIKELEENSGGGTSECNGTPVCEILASLEEQLSAIPEIPTNVSAFTNDAGYQTAAQLSTAILPLLPLVSYLGAAGHTGDTLETIVLTFTIQPNQWLPKAMYQVIADCNRIAQSVAYRIYLNTAPVIAGGILIFQASGAVSINAFRHFMVDGNAISHTDGAGTTATDINSGTNATRVLSTLDRSVPIFVICTIQGSVNAANGEFLNIQIGLV